jgi:hypothetical protein
MLACFLLAAAAYLPVFGRRVACHLHHMLHMQSCHQVWRNVWCTAHPQGLCTMCTRVFSAGRGSWQAVGAFYQGMANHHCKRRTHLALSCNT